MKYRIALLFALSFLAQPVWAEDIVQRLLGVWIGEGSVRPNGFGQPEKIRCKVKGVQMSDLQVSFAGRCATTSGAGAFRIVLAQDVVGTRFAAKIRFSPSEQDVDFKGRITGDRVVLKQSDPLQQGDRLLQSEITLALPMNSDIKMTNMLTDKISAEQTQSLEIRFVRQN